MSKGQGQKAKLLWLKRILEEETDPEHALTLPQLMERLRAQGVDIRDRKSVYDDLETLRVLGCDIASRREGRQTGYYLDSRTFELAELKLLVDAVQSSRFITRKKTGELIQKVEGLASRHQARQLQRQVFVSRRIKAMNESIYYTVDALYAAIELGERIRFHYFEWALDSASGRAVRRLRKGGDWYECSPWALIWDNENYYLVAFDGPTQSLRHYRVDKMLDITPTGEAREGGAAYAAFDPGEYAAGMFGMYHGAVETVTLRLGEQLLGVAADRFGRETFFRPVGEHQVECRAAVAVSPQFFSWVFGLGTGAEIVAPESVRKQYAAMLREVFEKQS